MKIRFVLVFAAVFLAIGIFLSSDFQTTESAGLVNSKCFVRSFKTNYRQSKAVFVGEVVNDEKNGDIRTFKFNVEKYWKGANTKNVEVNAYETRRYQAGFKKGEKYLIYAGVDENGKLQIGRCSRSVEAANATKDLEQLGKGKIPR